MTTNKGARCPRIKALSFDMCGKNLGSTKWPLRPWANSWANSKHYFSHLKKEITIPISKREIVKIKENEEWSQESLTYRGGGGRIPALERPKVLDQVAE